MEMSVHSEKVSFRHPIQLVSTDGELKYPAYVTVHVVLEKKIVDRPEFNTSIEAP